MRKARQPHSRVSTRHIPRGPPSMARIAISTLSIASLAPHQLRRDAVAFWGICDLVDSTAVGSNPSPLPAAGF